MSTPTITVQGRLVADPELRFTQSGAAVANITIATSDRRKNDAGEWEDGDKAFLRASLWREEAEHAADALHKGDQVIATGRLVQREYEDREGQKRSAFELKYVQIAAAITRRQTVTVNRTSASIANSSGGGAPVGGVNDPWAPQSADNPPF